MIRIKKDYNEFKFIVNRHYSYTMDKKCQNCNILLISNEYIKIIKRLEKRGLLQKNYKHLCCYCFFIKQKIGYTKCPDCNKPLTTGFFDDIVLCERCSRAIAYILTTHFV